MSTSGVGTPEDIAPHEVHDLHSPATTDTRRRPAPARETAHDVRHLAHEHQREGRACGIVVEDATAGSLLSRRRRGMWSRCNLKPIKANGGIHQPFFRRKRDRGSLPCPHPYDTAIHQLSSQINSAATPLLFVFGGRAERPLCSAN